MDDLIEKNNEIVCKIEEYLLIILKSYKCENKTKLSCFFKCVNGGTFKSCDYIDFSLEKLITIKNIDQSGFNVSNPTYFKKSNKYEKYRLEISDILLTMTGAYLGRCGIVDEDNCFQNQRILKVCCESKAFCYTCLKMYQNEIFQLGKGSAQPNLSLDDFYNYEINFKSSIIKEFKKFDALFDYILYHKIENKKLYKIKSFLLSKYF